MPKSALDFPELTTVDGDDVVYVIHGVDLTRDRNAKLSTLAKYFATKTREVYVLTGAGPHSFDVTGKTSGVILVTDTSTELTVAGTPTTNTEFTVINGTETPLTVNSSSGILGMPVTGVSSVVLENTGDALVMTCAANPPLSDVWIGQYVPNGINLASDVADAKARVDNLQTVLEYHTAGAAPEATWSSSGSTKTVGTLSLPAGKWLLDATVNGTTQTGLAAELQLTCKWDDNSATAYTGAVSHRNVSSSSDNVSCSLPRRYITLAAPTTMTLRALAVYSGGAGNFDAWVSIIAQRVE